MTVTRREPIMPDHKVRVMFVSGDTMEIPDVVTYEEQTSSGTDWVVFKTAHGSMHVFVAEGLFGHQTAPNSHDWSSKAVELEDKPTEPEVNHWPCCRESTADGHAPWCDKWVG